MLRALGPCQVTLNGSAMTAFRSSKALALLIYLAVEAERPHSREHLAGLFWPESHEHAARHSLRQVVANLRHALGEGDSAVLLVTRGGLQFNGDSDYWLDVAAFTAFLDECDRHPHHEIERCKPCVQRLQQAVELYQGDFLQQLFVSDSLDFEEWATIKREQLQQRMLTALGQLAAAYQQQGAYEQARVAVWRQVELAPWHEEAHRHLMHLYRILGQRSAALAQYESCRRMLAEALGVEPSEETTTLYEQIRAGNGLASPPPPRPLPSSRPHNLPAQPNALVGRAAELHQLGALIEDPGVRLICLTGPGGVGKSRLALQAALDQVDAFSDGLFLVPLAPLSDPALVLPTIADALGVEGRGEGSLLDRLKAHLAHKQMLLLLDNFEHLLPAAPLLTELLAASPQLELLVTSREVLGLYGEYDFPVPPLAVPCIDTRRPPEGSERLAAYAAVELFLQRARAATPGLHLTEENAPAIGEICARLDGLPLAIELVATRTKLFSPQAMLARLSQRLTWLTGGPRDLPARQRTLRATVDWSYELLDPEQKALFDRLAVFFGGWTLEAAAAVCQEESDFLGLLDGLTALFDKSLLQRGTGGDGEPRFWMLETLREYARERLVERGALHAAQRRHALFYLDLLERAEPLLRSADQPLWVMRLEAEHDNIRAALAWALEQDAADIGLRIVGTLRWFWTFRSHVTEGLRWAMAMLERAGEGGAAAARAKALWVAGVMAMLCEDPRAHALLEESVAIWRAVGDGRGLGYALQHLGLVVAMRGDYLLARALEEESLARFRALGDRNGIALAAVGLGHMVTKLGEYEVAEALFQESISIAHEINDKWTLALALHNLERLVMDVGDYERAGALLAECIELWGQVGTTHEIAGILTEVGQWAYDQGDLHKAARLFGSAHGFAEAVHAQPQQAHHPSHVDRLRAALGDEPFTRLWDEGRAMTVEQAAAYVRESAPRPDGAAP